MKAAFVGREPEIFDRVYGEKQRAELNRRVELLPGVFQDIRSEALRDVEAIFSTWGMPVCTEEEIRASMPNLKYLFYSAGTVQPFARPFLHCGVRVFSAWQANAVPVVQYTFAQIVLALFLCAVGASVIICALPSRKRVQSDYIMQKGENGPIGVSVRAIEKQVRACVAKHDLIQSAEVSIREVREGLVILLDVDQVAGVNIPLSVGLLQKQIRQYVTACTGVDVHEVRVLVENDTPDQVESVYAVQDTVMPAPARPVAEQKPIAEAAPAVEAEAPAPEKAEAEEHAAPAVPVAPVVVMPPMPEMPELPAEEDDRPLHQRLFGAEEQMAFVPAPPELVVEPSEPEEEEEAPEIELELETEENSEEPAADAEIPEDEAAEPCEATEEAEETTESCEAPEEAEEAEETAAEPEIVLFEADAEDEASAEEEEPETL